MRAKCTGAPFNLRLLYPFKTFKLTLLQLRGQEKFFFTLLVWSGPPRDSPQGNKGKIKSLFVCFALEFD